MERVSSMIGFTTSREHRRKNIVNAARISNLWHRRLGHPGSEAMSTLSNVLGFSNNSQQKLEVHDICFRAKQARTQFRASENKADNIFELVHCDIWVP